MQIHVLMLSPALLGANTGAKFNERPRPNLSPNHEASTKSPEASPSSLKLREISAYRQISFIS